MAREPWKITLLDVVNCIEGLDAQSTEQNREPKSVESAVILEIWQEARRAVDTVLQRYTLQDLTEKRDSRRQLDLMYYI